MTVVVNAQADATPSGAVQNHEGLPRKQNVPGSAPATTSPQAIAEPKLLMGYEKARLGLETQRSQTEGVIPILTAGTDG